MKPSEIIEDFNTAIRTLETVKDEMLSIDEIEFPEHLVFYSQVLAENNIVKAIMKLDNAISILKEIE